MSERGRSIARIVALQHKAQTIAAARLAVAEGAKAALVASRETLQAFVAGAELTGALAVTAITTTRSLMAREAEAETHRLTLAGVRRKAATKLKLAERVGEASAREEAMAAERRALERLIEEAAARGETETAE